MDAKQRDYSQSTVVLTHCRTILEYIEISSDEAHNPDMYNEYKEI